MADDDPNPHDDTVKSVPLPTEEGDVVVAQENQGAEVALGGGEWPSPKAPPTGPAPGVAPDRDEAARPGEVEETFPPIKDTLDVDPVAGGSQSVAPE